MTLQEYQENTFSIQPIFIANSEECGLFIQANTASFYFPFHLSNATDELKNIFDKLKNPPNLNPEIANKIATRLGLIFTLEKEIPEEGAVCLAKSLEVRPEFRLTFTATDVFDYIYSVLHSPVYRSKYKEFLKINSPRVPYPKDTTAFWQLVKFGGELKKTHLSALIEMERIMQEINKVEVD